MKTLLSLFLVACGTGPLEVGFVGAADSSTDAGPSDGSAACTPCHACAPDELGRPRYCDDKGTCRPDRVCSAPNPLFDAADPRCAPWQAAATGAACSTVLGWAYDGARCYELVGCACEGVDCTHLYNDAMPCGFDHALCPH